MIRVLTPNRPSSTGPQPPTQGCALAIMAKAPRPGAVKTRLSPPLTPGQAAQLNACFLKDTAESIAVVASSSPVPAAALVAYTPVGEEPIFHRLLPDPFLLVPQRGATFGERLLAAAADILACGFDSVCLIDSDSPTVPGEAYQRAADELSRPGDRVVLGPAADGGYYLIGMKRAHPAVFHQVPWSTGAVYSETRLRAHAASIEVVDLPLWYDVDDGATLRMLEAELLVGSPPPFATLRGYPAPHTRAFLLERDRARTTSPAEPSTGSPNPPGPDALETTLP